MRSLHPYSVHTRRGLHTGNELVNDGTREYDASFYATYAGSLKFDVSDRSCWYLDSAFCYNFHQFKTSVGSAKMGKVVIEITCWGIENGTIYDQGQVTDTPAGSFSMLAPSELKIHMALSRCMIT